MKASPSAKRLLGQLLDNLFPQLRISTKDYAEQFIYLPPEVTAIPGLVDTSRTPALLAFFKYIDLPTTRILVAKKCAQMGWTQAVNFWLEKIIVTNPRNILIAFPTEKLMKKYVDEKWKVAVRVSTGLSDQIGDPDKCRFDFYKFKKGGWLQLITGSSDNALKSSSAPILNVEEPDGLPRDLKGQGSAIEMFRQRSKTFPDSIIIYAGTPTKEGESNVDDAYAISNKMKFMVICHECQGFHELSFNQLKALPYPNGQVNVRFGRYDPSTAFYECPHCKSRWDTKQKNLNLLESTKYHDLGWVATAESDIIGFDYNELMSTLHGSSLIELKEKQLEAETLAETGEYGKLISFTNNSKGDVFSYRRTVVSVEELKAKRVAYPKQCVPIGAYILTVGIDVQHNRFAIQTVAHGRHNNSFVVDWFELYGAVPDIADVVWTQLTEYCTTPWSHQLHDEIKIPISAISIDSGDGNTTRLVYQWVRAMNTKNPYVFATKGDSGLAKEIYTIPNQSDLTRSETQYRTLYETYGVKPYIVGVQLAKDDTMTRLALGDTANKDRIYVGTHIREDWEHQMLSNVKRGARYELLTGQRDEGLDTFILNEHAKRAIGVHLFTERQFDTLEQQFLNKLHMIKAGTKWQ